jgi:hypothetical protein
MAVLIAPNIDIIRTTTEEANLVDEEVKFKEYTDAIEDAAATGIYEVVFAEEIERFYEELLKNGGYSVHIGKYNNTEKICTLVEWRKTPKWTVEGSKTENGDTRVIKVVNDYKEA